jgi:hypothetical protein
MNKETLITGLNAMQMQSSSVTLEGNRLKVDKGKLSQAHRLISNNKEAALLVRRYAHETEISIPDIEPSAFLSWCQGEVA